MFIVIHCAGMPFNGETVAKESLGGSESAAYYVARDLARRGHRVVVFTTSPQEGVWDDVKYIHLGPQTEQAPFGERFHQYAENTPHDVLIVQRHPLAFRFPWACKVGLWWLHDLALGRLAGQAIENARNCDGILTVSEWHRQQVIATWGLKPEFVRAIQNGVDLSLFEGEIEHRPLGFSDRGQFKLLYAARPERGLINLVKEGGVMERLKKELPQAHLYVCTYDNKAPQLQGLYDYLDARGRELGNVTKLGALTKKQLADVMRQCDLYVYPTTFEDTSCIAMMECAAAGLPVVTSEIAALPETTAGGGVIRIGLKEDGEVDIDFFVSQILASNKYARLRELQREIAPRFDWSVAVDKLLAHIHSIFNEKASSDGAIIRHLIRVSDIYAAHYALRHRHSNPIVQRCQQELEQCYGFAWDGRFKEHYERYYQYEKDRGVNYGPEDLSGNLRFEHVRSLLHRFDLPSGSLVIDYGCAHGHYTVNLARLFPQLQFVGIDIAQSNIDIARAWAERDGIRNVQFYTGEVTGDDAGHRLSIQSSEEARRSLIGQASVVIAAEVLEHVANPVGLATNLKSLFLREDGWMIVTTPFGPWEGAKFHEHHPWRAHLHHFERQDLHEIFGNEPGFSITVVPGGAASEREIVGSYVTIFQHKDGRELGQVDYGRKLRQLDPRQTLSVCYIVRNAEATLRRSLDSVRLIADEIVLAIDETTDDGTFNVIEAFKHANPLWPVVRTLSIESPLKIGFAEARNRCIAEASGDWVMWLDSDEIVVHADRIPKYLRNNAFDGYAMKQHHFTVEPLGVQKTDLPCRLFRNHRGVKFFGVVHEHPEVELNKGVGHVTSIPDVDIAHEGYTTEEIRRQRFARNIGLMVRDREENPERILGKFLWIRDLAQMCGYELRVTGRASPQMRTRAVEGIKLFGELLEDERTPLPMLLDALEYYSVLVTIQNPESLQVGFEVSASKLNGGLPPGQRVVARVASSHHARLLVQRSFEEKVKRYESKYY